MSSDPDYERRLREEAEFQNRRVASTEEGEARDKFYFLAEKAIARYRELLSDVDGKRVLIVGCSEGGVTPMARKGAFATGIDIAEEPIRRLNEAIKREGLSGRASALVMNAEDLDFPADSFDLICCSGVLHHLDVERATASWSRVLKPGGQVVMVEPMAWNPVVSLYRAVTPSMRTKDEHPLKPKDIRTLKKYFGRVEVEGFVLTSVLSLTWVYLPDLFSLRERSLSVLERFDQALLRFFPRLSYFCWTSVIEGFEPRKL